LEILRSMNLRVLLRGESDMGSYNTIKYEEKCLSCGTMLSDWQTKDAIIIVTTKSGEKFRLNIGFYMVKIEDVSEGSIVSICPNRHCTRFSKLLERKIKKGNVVVLSRGEK